MGMAIDEGLLYDLLTKRRAGRFTAEELGLISLRFQPAFRVNCRGAAHTRGGYGLAIFMINAVAARKYALNRSGGGARFGYNVSFLVQFDLADKNFGIGFVANGDKKTVTREVIK